ncbi:hypothetical protein AAMO2058_000704200 [Amorphochlora amoebiformis]
MHEMLNCGPAVSDRHVSWLHGLLEVLEETSVVNMGVIGSLIKQVWYINVPLTAISICVLAFLYSLLGGRTYRTTIKGKTVLVTGASSGLGKQLAIECARRGAAKVIVVARRREKLQETAHQIQSLGSQSVVVPCDVSDAKAVEMAGKEIEEKHGTVHVLINNAGAGPWKHIEDTSAEEARRMMAVPYQAAFTSTRVFARRMMQEKNGHIMNVTSVVGYAGIPGAVGYGAARWAMRGFTRHLRADLRELGIGVTLLTPAEICDTEYFSNKSGCAGEKSYSHMPYIFHLCSTIFSITSKSAAVSGVNAMEYGWSIAAPPAWLVQPLLLLESYFPELIDWIGRLGGAACRKA